VVLALISEFSDNLEWP